MKKDIARAAAALRKVTTDTDVQGAFLLAFDMFIIACVAMEKAGRGPADVALALVPETSKPMLAAVREIATSVPWGEKVIH